MSSKKSPGLSVFWPWEAATGAPASAMPGMVPDYLAPHLTAASAVVGAALLWPLLGPWGVPLAVVLARLVALDLTTHTLPDVYTLPLLAVGVVHGLGAGDAAGLLVALMMICGYNIAGMVWPNQNIVGGGDLKLLAAMFAGLGVPLACFAVATGCLLWLPVAFFRPRKAQPLGVPLIIGSVAVTVAAPYIL